MTVVNLGDVAHECREKCVDDLLKFKQVGLEHLDTGSITLTRWDEPKESTFTKMFHKGQILFGRRNVYLKKAVVAPFDGICSGDITVLEPSPGKIYPSYLPFVIQNDDFFVYADRKATGTMSRRIKWNWIQKYEFNLPSIETQKRIADILWAIEDTKQAYNKLLLMIDEVVKSQFIEMFGNITNKEKLIDRSKIEKGVILTRENAKEGNVPVVAGGIKPSCYHNVSNRDKNTITISASGANAGYVNYWKIPIFATDCITINSKDSTILDNHYIYSFLKTIQDEIFKMQHGTSQPHVYISDLSHILIPIPSINLQNKYSILAHQADKLKFELKKAIEDLDNMGKQILSYSLK